MALVKILFIADIHLGFDFPFRPRIERRRRGPDFFNNFTDALQPAMTGEIDCVIHGGDLLFRSRVPARLVYMAFEPLIKVADLGVPVFLVPGNHERSVIPYQLLATHPNIHIFYKPITYLLKVGSSTLGLVGFPYMRNNIRKHFPEVLQQTGWLRYREKVNGYILCMHHCCEGAAVGPGNFTFRFQEDVIKVRDIPEGFAAVLSGHIHRFQIIKKDLNAKSIASPILYAGSIERTSFAEMSVLRAESLRSIAPKTMNISLALSDYKNQKLPHL